MSYKDDDEIAVGLFLDKSRLEVADTVSSLNEALSRLYLIDLIDSLPLNFTSHLDFFKFLCLN